MVLAIGFGTHGIEQFQLGDRAGSHHAGREYVMPLREDVRVTKEANKGAGIDKEPHVAHDRGYLSSNSSN